jgi:glycosyltransferase involved in cell wall biosynthesis
MKILFCSEFFYPSIGGAQEVVKQLSVRFAKAGHHVEIATTYLDTRKNTFFENIKINSFHVSGNYANGILGDVTSYIGFVLNGNFDLIFIYAAQQWTLDALIGSLDQIKAKKVLVPCGFSGLYLEQYQTYFNLMPEVLNHFDQLIFHSNNYRDFEFAKKNSNVPTHLISNAADNNEFDIEINGFRSKFGIAHDEFVILTVGSITGSKGHLEVIKSFSLLDSRKNLVLILNGNHPGIQFKLNKFSFFKALRKALSIKMLKKIMRILFDGFKDFLGIKRSYSSKLSRLVKEINRGQYGSNKRVILCDLDRIDLISSYFESDLFVFASQIEYSPLVLFEACAAGLPFISVDVGNSLEIASWTRGGVICPSKRADNGNTITNPKILAKHVDQLISNPSLLISLGREGRQSWQKSFNWDLIAKQYEQVFCNLLHIKSSETS